MEGSLNNAFSPSTYKSFDQDTDKELVFEDDENEEIPNDDEIENTRDSDSSEGSNWSPKGRFKPLRKSKNHRRGKRDIYGSTSENYNNNQVFNVQQKCKRPRGRPIGSKNRKSNRTGDKNFACDICDEEFRSMYFLKKHQQKHQYDNIKVNHLSNGAYQCGVCGKIYMEESKLQVHLRVHCEDKPYTCNVCGTGFNQFINLQTHERLHAEDDQFKCNFCRMTFRQLTNLKQHEKLMHNQ